MTTYHHPTIGAQQLQERADKVVIANATGNPDLFSEAVKDLLAAVRMFRPAPDALDDFASAGDNTLHGAIDHWQARAIKAEAALAVRDAQTPAARDVLAERQRQISAEGWAPDHDDAHTLGEIAGAAGCYAIHASEIQNGALRYPANPYAFWPWDRDWWKPTTPRRDLVKAGALILAEIERLDRAAIAAQRQGDA
ncbi:hypothetical protein [Achromobacter sp. AONIH1]|uniref:hypothetical protein n=1 Tax=Achromobacter sp. AONIH1 TaxID=1758194 RepID=UPI0018F81A6D|nr:hypothetical protein [Achromobacter sp. AONIH1]